MTATRTPLAHVQRYFQAWNDRDPAAVVAAFADGGTYADPNVAGPPLSGRALASYARALFEGFPTRSPADADEVRAISRPLAAALREAPGFLSWMGVGIGSRMFTITAREDEEAVRQVTSKRLHRDAVGRFFSDGLGLAVHTSVWSAITATPCGCGAPRASGWPTPPAAPARAAGGSRIPHRPGDGPQCCASAQERPVALDTSSGTRSL